MNENKSTDKSPDRPLNDRLSQDLKGLFEPEPRNWAAIDRKVMDHAARTLLPRRKRRWVYMPAAAAAAITIAAGLLLMQFTHHKPAAPSSMATLSEDVDRNGHVDILDAFRLAKMVQSAARPDARWDMNADSIVNQQDVDIVARAAVTLRKDML